MAQMSNVRAHNRETLRSYRDLPSPGYRSNVPSPNYRVGLSPSKNHRDGARNGSSPGADLPASPSKKARGSGGGSITPKSSCHWRTPESSKKGEENLSLVSNRSGKENSSARKVDNDSGDVDENDLVQNNVETIILADFENGVPPPLWKDEEGINLELAATYKYPRLYFGDPARVIGNGADDGQKIRPWWFHLARRMNTTLGHVHNNHLNALISQQTQKMRSGCGHDAHHYDDSVSAASSSSVPYHSSFGCAGVEDVAGASSDGCVAIKEICLGQNEQQQLQQRQAARQITANGKSHRKSMSFSSHGSKHKPKKGGTTATVASTAAASFDRLLTPVNAWSEPSATTMKVRGPSYGRDGVKVESKPSMFSVLGADSFVSGGHGGKIPSPTWGTDSFLRRWTSACEDVGLESPLFLLIINFIVPWGNFQAYFIRPDGIGGPFSSRHKDRPSEKAWHKFMEGTTDYRNKHFKLIPRVCAGPWMVKKMVGSTPAIVGTKLPVSYRGSAEENYLEISLDVTKGPAFGNSIANTVVGKADVITVDLGFVIEGCEEEGHLPEQLLGLVRLHHLDMKRAPTHSQWRQVLEMTQR